MRRRIHIQRAAGFVPAIKAAMSMGRLPREWFDALCDHEDEVAEAMYKANADRAEASLKRRFHR